MTKPTNAHKEGYWGHESWKLMGQFLIEVYMIGPFCWWGFCWHRLDLCGVTRHISTVSLQTVGVRVGSSYRHFGPIQQKWFKNLFCPCRPSNAVLDCLQVDLIPVGFVFIKKKRHLYHCNKKSSAQQQECSKWAKSKNRLNMKLRAEVFNLSGSSIRERS